MHSYVCTAPGYENPRQSANALHGLLASVHLQVRLMSESVVLRVLLQAHVKVGDVFARATCLTFHKCSSGLPVCRKNC